MCAWGGGYPESRYKDINELAEERGRGNAKKDGGQETMAWPQ